MRRVALIAAFIAAAAFGGVGCGGGSSDAPATHATAPATTSAAEATGTPTGTTGAKVSANTGTADQIQAALEAAGVQNAERWTREVMEYRPYDTADPTLAQLRQELLKYNPAEDQLARILGALTP